MLPVLGTADLQHAGAQGILNDSHTVTRPKILILVLFGKIASDDYWTGIVGYIYIA